MRSVSRSGWFFESARHSLAARGIPTGRGFFSRKYMAGVGSGNRDPGWLKALYNWRIKKSDLGLEYSKRKSRYSPELAFALAKEARMQQSAPMMSRMEPMQFSRGEDLAAPPTPPPEPRMPESAQVERVPMEEEEVVQKTAPWLQQQQEQPMNDVEVMEKTAPWLQRPPQEAQESPVSEREKMVGERLAEQTVEKMMSENPKISTPGVPPETRSMLAESFEVTI